MQFSRQADLVTYARVVVLFIIFFFSSRRRHTRYIGDWSSDVCSSDLGAGWRRPVFAFGGRALVGRNFMRDSLAEKFKPSGIPRPTSNASLWVDNFCGGTDRKSVV